MLKARGELLEEYPLTQLYADLRDAQLRNMTYAAIYIEVYSVEKFDHVCCSIYYRYYFFFFFNMGLNCLFEQLKYIRSLSKLLLILL